MPRKRRQDWLPRFAKAEFAEARLYSQVLVQSALSVHHDLIVGGGAAGVPVDFEFVDGGEYAEAEEEARVGGGSVVGRAYTSRP
jgi:hypothetical protein